MEMNNNHMADEQIFEMLKPKLEKNGLNQDGHFTCGNNIPGGWRSTDYYTKETMEKIVGLAYRKGYGRGAKGRPFNYAEAKNKIEDVKSIKPNTHNFQVGDKVVYVGRMCKTGVKERSTNNYCPQLGSIGIITEIDGKYIYGCNCKVQWEKDSGVKTPYCWWEFACALRRVIGKKPEKGDNVVMVEEHPYKKSIGKFYPHVGYCGKVSFVDNDTGSWVIWENGALDIDHDGESWNIPNRYLAVVE